MAKQNSLGITAKKAQNPSEWYSQVCLKSELADYGPSKGSMIIRPNGYSIWQAIQDYFNKEINQKLNVRNAYFPLFIPESFFKKEARHAKGFSPEVAWLDKSVTGDGERLAVRPTSETIMYDSFSKWIRSHKELPFRINQWCSVVRWETQATKLFLRSREFLWQEGHCVYETEKECEKETIELIKMYAKLCEDLLAMPVLIGAKTEKEKFAGAETTYGIEAFMPDGKALQCGTTHDLGQGFAKAFGITYLDKNEKSKTPWQNSWGLSTRLIGGMVMTHSDDKGLVLPPRVAENKVVIIPIAGSKADKLKKQLEEFNPILDERKDYSPGYKFNEWELKGIPIRIEIGPKDVAKKQVILVRRDTGIKKPVKVSALNKEISKELDEMHKAMLNKAKKFLKQSTTKIKNFDELKIAINQKKLALAHFCGKPHCEELIKDKTDGASSRVIPLNSKSKGKCIKCNKPGFEVYFSKSY